MATFASMAKAGEQLLNPSTGERIVFRRTAAETGGLLLEMDDYWGAPGHRAPEHVHPAMTESWEVISGAVCFRIDGVERIAGPGESVTAPAGTRHAARNAGAEAVHLRIQMRPALEWERFVERLFALGSEQAGGAHDADALLALLREFPSEIALPEQS